MSDQIDLAKAQAHQREEFGSRYAFYFAAVGSGMFANK